ncbi:MAG: hypothetical protein AAGH15_13590 [Myxococcota bacterium]
MPHDLQPSTALPSPGRVESYGFDGPSGVESRRALCDMFGGLRGEDIWSRACARAGVDASGPYSGAELSRVADRLIEEGGLASVIGRTLKIHALTFVELSHAEATR